MKFLRIFFRYREAFNSIVEKDGIIGLLGRGLKTRILTNGI
jgi:hypothetical protein